MPTGGHNIQQWRQFLCSSFDKTNLIKFLVGEWKLQRCRPVISIDNQDALIETEPASGESLGSSVLNADVQDSMSSDQVISKSL